MRGLIGVAISTTGDPHRLGFLETCVQGWRDHLPLGSVIVVTVDGDEEAVERACTVSNPNQCGNVYRVGQPYNGTHTLREGRLGVAVNKNTGLELLMAQGVKHLFLCDDDTWPKSADALKLHVDSLLAHSMVCWGRHRNPVRHAGYTGWSWPRGVLLYTARSVVDQIGGMDEQFGPGGHEHVEWSRRIHQTGLTPVPYPTPHEYGEGRLAMGAAAFWHAEDMPRKGEPFGNFRLRKRHLTSVRRTPEDWPIIEAIMNRRNGDTSFVPYSAVENHRASATLYHNLRADVPQV